MDYKATVNLPRTDFPMKANLVQMEINILKQWTETKIYHQILAARTGAKEYVFHDGPPNANSHMHIGTALNRVLKDIIVKSKTMSGYRVPFIPGWDCLGMPIEYEIIKGADEKLLPNEIRERGREFAEKYIDIQRQEFKRLGEFADWEHPYITMSNEYEANVIDVFKSLVEKGFVYRANRPVHWCPKCRTALAEAELEYKEMGSPSIYVKFKTENPDLSILIWTTTPWTLPANVACAMNPDLKYDFVKIGNETLIIAESLRDIVIKKLQITDYKVEKSVLGKELDGLTYMHPIFDKKGQVVLSDFVSKESGTGCVHIAPGHGYEDYLVGLEYNLPLVSPVDEFGRFTEEVPQFKGKYVFDANKLIVESLKSRCLVLYAEEVSHSYPCCWRCKTPLIFRATAQWFLKIDHNNLRKQCIEEIDKVNWLPKWSKERILHNIVERPDWCLSRQRSLGVPIPVVYCNNCGEPILDITIIDKAKEAIRKEGAEGWFALQELGNLTCPKCSHREFRKEENIFDVWFASSSSWTVIRSMGSFPSDIYCEGVDQHRGWFQHSLWLSLIAEDRSCFKAVLTHGLVLDQEMKKMSKSLGNIVSPMSVIDKYGADILRLYFASIDYTSDLPFDPDTLESIVTAYRKIRNTFKFMLGNLYDFYAGGISASGGKDRVDCDKLFEIDKLMLHRLTMLIKTVKSAYSDFEFYKVYRSIYDYCVVDLSKFYFDILKDRLYTYGKNSIGRRSAQTILSETLTSLTKLVAPLIPFTAEEIWQYQIQKSEDRGQKTEDRGDVKSSVHLELMPETKEVWIDNKLADEYKLLEEVRDDVLVGLEDARKSNFIGNPLEAKVILWTDSKELRDLISNRLDLLPTIFIVSQVSIDKVKDMQRLKKIDVRIVKAEGEKCQRCWIRSIEVGKDLAFPTLCSKCAGVLKDGDYDRTMEKQAIFRG
ncbi:MAG: isoleucine--tRNA ligase [Candidatus Stahlbacteria bacterium]|nr:isoleucine--tRNA ligase [Candidatus Stahlbacteria bacterium]